jgi:hypothetical protein
MKEGSPVEIITNAMQTGLASACAPIAINAAVAPWAHQVSGASAVASPLAAVKPTFALVKTPLLPEPKTQIQRGGYASKPELMTKKVDGLRGVPPRGRPVK